MKVALVHDYLDQFGGQERVLLNLMELFPDAPIYTLLYNPESMGKHLGHRQIHTSFLDTPFVRRRHRAFIPILGHAAESINLGDQYDLIVSNTMGFVKGVRYTKGTHISYVHAPLRYAWEPHEFLGDLFPKPLIWAGMPLIRYVRWQDKKFSRKPDHIIANSHNIASKIKRFYGRESDVVYPPVEGNKFYFDPQVEKQNYYFAYGRIIHFKKFPLIVETFRELGLPLKIAGTGPDEKTVRRLANGYNNIEIHSFLGDDALRKMIAAARAVIVPQLEDFGLVSAEAISCGTPVIGYGMGGTAEIVQNGINGILFKDQTVESLKSAIKEFENKAFDPRLVTQTANKFSKEEFKRNFMDLVNKTLNEKALLTK